MNDGLVTTIGFVAGVSATLATPHLVLLAGIAEMVAGAFSMGVGSYLSTKSQRDFFQAEIARETKEISETPDHEVAEAREIYRDMGFEPEEVEMIVRRLRANPKLFLKLMLRDELGIVDQTIESPLRNARNMGLAFFAGSVPPLVPYLFLTDGALAFKVSVGASLAAMFAIGAGRTSVTRKGFLASGLEVVAFGVAATVAGWLGGLAVGQLVGAG